MMKKKSIKIIYLLMILCIISIILYVNIYPPIFEIQGTYHEYYDERRDNKSVYKYYMVQNPPSSNDNLLKMMKEYFQKTDEAKSLLLEQIKKSPEEEIQIEFIFCKKSYSPFGLHRFWRSERWDYIQSYSQYYIARYQLTYNNGVCTDVYAVFDPLYDCVETNTYEFVQQ